MRDYLTVLSVVLIGLVALGAIILLSLYDHVVPNEVSSLPAVALGILGGLAIPRKTNEPE